MRAVIAAVVLAGGRGTRMGGRDKALLPLAGRPLVEHVIDRIAPQVDLVALSANGDPARFEHFGLPVLADCRPDRPGPLAGILVGMDWAAAEGATALVAVATDTPFLPTDLVARLGAAGPFAMAATPGEGGPERHPTAALWPLGLREELRASLEAGQRRVADWALARGCTTVPFADRRAFLNVNTAEDLTLAAAIAGDRA